MKVRIPTPLQGYTGGRALVEASGRTVAAVARDLDRRYPGIRFRMIDEQDRVRPHIKIFVDARQARALETPVAPGAEVMIVQSFSGG